MPTKAAKAKRSDITDLPKNGSNGHVMSDKKTKSDSWRELGLTRDDILNDYRTSHQSRWASLRGRREVLTGKAKFGIFGDGKEVPQVAMARAFENGDWRAGYYRDQTFMRSEEHTSELQSR